MIASFAGVMCSCEDDDKLVTNADAITVSAGSIDSYTTPNTARVKVWYKKENYSQIETAGVLYGTTKDLDFLITYGYDLSEKFANDTVWFDLSELEPNTEYYYVGYAKVPSNVPGEYINSYSGIRYFKTLKDDISITPGLITFNPVDLANLDAKTLSSNIVVKTQYADWQPSVNKEDYPWIESATRLDDTTLQVVVKVISDSEAATYGRSGQVRISASTNESATKERAVLVNQLPASIQVANDTTYTNLVATGNFLNIGKINVDLDWEASEAPEWCKLIRANDGTLQITYDANKVNDYRLGKVKFVADMLGDDDARVVNLVQNPAMLLDTDTLYLGYASESVGIIGVTTYEGNVKLTTDTRKNASDYFQNGNENQRFRIITPATGGIQITALTTNQNLEPQVYPLTIYFVDSEGETYTRDAFVCQNATTFTIDVDNFEFPKSIASYTVNTSHSGATTQCDADWVEATVDGTVVTIKTTSEATSERTTTVNIVWGEHVCPVTVKQLTANDGVAEDYVDNMSINLPYGETLPVAVDFNNVLDKFGLTSTAMDAYYVSSTAGKGKFKADSKSIIWRALLADGNPYLSEGGNNIYTGEGYGSWYDANGNASTATDGIIALNFDEATGAINVVCGENAEVGKTYTGQLQLAYNQPAEGKLNTYTIKVSVTIGTALLKEVVFTGTTGGESYNNRTIDSLMAYAFSVEEDLIAGMIQNGEIEMVGLNADGTEVAQKTYGTTGFIFSADGNVGTYPNPVYVEYKNSRIYIAVIEGVATTVPSGTYGVKFKYNGIELPVYFK